VSKSFQADQMSKSSECCERDEYDESYQSGLKISMRINDETIIKSSDSDVSESDESESE
jgi:hypothetical protein